MPRACEKCSSRALPGSWLEAPWAWTETAAGVARMALWLVDALRQMIPAREGDLETGHGTEIGREAADTAGSRW